MKFKINDNAFKGLTQFNGQTVTQEFAKGTTKPITGTTGMKAFTLSTGGRVYLSEDQYKPV